MSIRRPSRPWPALLVLVLVALACAPPDRSGQIASVGLTSPSAPTSSSASTVAPIPTPGPASEPSEPSNAEESPAGTGAPTSAGSVPTTDSPNTSGSAALAPTTENGAITTAKPTTASSTAVVSSSSSPPVDDPPGGEGPTPIRLRLDRRVGDVDTEGFEALVRAVLTDQRGWTRAGFEFTFDETDHDYTVVLAEGTEVDSICLPYDTGGRFSCQIGPVVALNADRWRTAVESWPASLDEYRTMLVNHEVGHLIGQHHPASRCPGDGRPAPVMAQQSSGVAPCTANPWPLEWEIVCARQGVEPLAPPYENDITLTCGPDGPVE